MLKRTPNLRVQPEFGFANGKAHNLEDPVLRHLAIDLSNSTGHSFFVVSSCEARDLGEAVGRMHAHRFGMNFEETIVGKLAEVYQTVHLKEFTDFPKKDEKDPTTVFTDIHFEKKSIAHEAYHLSHGYCQ